MIHTFALAAVLLAANGLAQAKVYELRTCHCYDGRLEALKACFRNQPAGRIFVASAPWKRADYDITRIQRPSRSPILMPIGAPGCRHGLRCGGMEGPVQERTRAIVQSGPRHRYRIHLESRQTAPGTISGRLAAVRRLSYEATDSAFSGPISPPASGQSKSPRTSAFLLVTGLPAIKQERSGRCLIRIRSRVSAIEPCSVSRQIASFDGEKRQCWTSLICRISWL